MVNVTFIRERDSDRDKLFIDDVSQSSRTTRNCFAVYYIIRTCYFDDTYLSLRLCFDYNSYMHVTLLVQNRPTIADYCIHLPLLLYSSTITYCIHLPLLLYSSTITVVFIYHYLLYSSTITVVFIYHYLLYSSTITIVFIYHYCCIHLPLLIVFIYHYYCIPLPLLEENGASCIQGQVVTDTFYETIAHIWSHHRQ